MNIIEIRKNLIAEVCVLIIGACGLVCTSMLFVSIAIAVGWSEFVLPLAIIAGVIVPVLFSIVATCRVRYYLLQLENKGSEE